MNTSWVVLICLLLLVASIDAGKKGKNKEKRRKQKAAKCETISTMACTRSVPDLPYNKTRLPNIMGHEDQLEVNAEIDQYWSLIKMGCSPYIGYFICSAFLPECPKKKKMKTIPPCRELCIKAKEGCDEVLQSLDLDWPVELSCDLFPRYDESKSKKKGRANCFNYEPVLPTRMIPAPRVLENPMSMTIMVGEILELSCRAEGEPPLQFAWSKLEGAIPADRSLISTQVITLTQPDSTKSTLRILDAEGDDSGTYICMVSNLGGTIEVNSRIDVQMPPSFSRRPQDTVVNEGNTARLQCEAHGYPDPHITWFKVHDVLKPARGSMMDDILFIADVGADDAGTYLCVATNSAGYLNVTASLEVLTMPRIENVPDDMTAEEGGEVTFHCAASAIPKPVIEWTKSRGELPSDRTNITVNENGTTLRLFNIQTYDVGIYTCTASNVVGSVTANILFEVQVKPSIHSIEPLRYVAEIGEDAIFMCKFSGHPTPSVLWYRKGTENLLFPGGGSMDRFQVTVDGMLIIDSVKKEDEGDYVCSVMNTAGNDKSESYLEVIPTGTKSVRELPSVETTVMAESNVTLACRAIGDSQYTVQWVFNQKPLTLGEEVTHYSLDDSGSLVIKNITTNERGTYTCISAHVWGSRYAATVVMVLAPTTEPTTTDFTTTTTKLDETTIMEVTTAQQQSVDLTSISATTVIETSEETPKLCPPCQAGTVKPRRYDILDAGLEGYFRGWVDVQGQGAANDYCRIIAAGEVGFQLACALAGTMGDNEYNYISTADLEVGYEGTWYMKDENGDGKDDYCRCVGEGGKAYVWCMEAGGDGFHGSDPNNATTGSQYSFKAPGKRKDLKQCADRTVDPFLGMTDK